MIHEQSMDLESLFSIPFQFPAIPPLRCLLSFSPPQLSETDRTHDRVKAIYELLKAEDVRTALRHLEPRSALAAEAVVSAKLEQRFPSASFPLPLGPSPAAAAADTSTFLAVLRRTVSSAPSHRAVRLGGGRFELWRFQTVKDVDWDPVAVLLLRFALGKVPPVP